MSNLRHLVSRNKREGWYAGFRVMRLSDRHQRSGLPMNDIDWVPCPDPLKKSVLKRYQEPIHCFFKE